MVQKTDSSCTAVTAEYCKETSSQYTKPIQLLMGQGREVPLKCKKTSGVKKNSLEIFHSNLPEFFTGLSLISISLISIYLCCWVFLALNFHDNELLDIEFQLLYFQTISCVKFQLELL